MSRLKTNSFLEVIEVPVDGTRPQRVSDGVGFSLGASNVMGSYVQLLAGGDVSGGGGWPDGCGDGFGIFLSVTNVGVTSQAHNALMTIGIDPSGGSSYTDWIENLLISAATTNTVGGAYTYYFPIRIPHGAALAVKGQDSHATPVATSYCRLRIYCKPTHPELIRVGTFVKSFGVDMATSAGTGVTEGTGSDGAYTQLGSALDKEIFYWEWGVGVSGTSIVGSNHLVDIAVGDASNKRRVIRNAMWIGATTETIGKPPSGEYGPGAIGDLVYARSQNGGAQPGLSYAAYGVGG